MSRTFGVNPISDPIPVPWDSSAWIQVRSLTGRECEQAQAAHRDSFLGSSPRLWSSVFRRALEKGATDPEARKALADPLLGFDRYVVAASGLAAWSSPTPLTAVISEPEKLTAKQVRELHYAVREEAIEPLREEEVEFISVEVMRRTKPALFLTSEEDAQAAQKEP